MMKPLKVLIVEDYEPDAALMLRELRQAGYDPVYRRVDTAMEMSRALDAERWDIVTSDHVMPGFSSSAALKLIQDKGLDLPFIIVSGRIGEDAAVDAMKAGANDYVMKDNLKRLVPAIEREVHDAELRRARQRIEGELLDREDDLRRTHARHLATLKRLSQSLGKAKDLDTLLGKALGSVMEALRSSSGALFVRDATNGELILGAASGASPEFPEISSRMLARANADCKTEDTRGSAFLKRLLGRTVVMDTHKLGVQSEHTPLVVSVPLKSAGKTIAVALLPSSARKAPSGEERRLLNAIGSQIAVAIENALLLQEMSRMSMTDELTRLYNRRHFYRVLEIEMARAQRFRRPLSLAILDVDRFKDCNDKFGHNSGDRVLVSLAGAMTSDSRQIDTSFRYGGDEFAIIMPETDSGGARGVVERIRLKWLEMLRTESPGLEDLLGLSAGIGEFPRDAAAQDSLVLLVDAALYSSKRSGVSRSTLVSEMGERPHDTPSSSPSDQV